MSTLRYDIDDKARALQIIGFWKADTASAFEAHLLNAIRFGDREMRERLRREFPALVWAYESVTGDTRAARPAGATRA